MQAISSSLASAIELELDKQDLITIAGKIPFLRKYHPTNIRKILEQADEQLPESIGKTAIKLTNDLCGSRYFCKMANINYASISEQDSRLIKTSIADYLLKKQKQNKSQA